MLLIKTKEISLKEKTTFFWSCFQQKCFLAKKNFVQFEVFYFNEKAQQRRNMFIFCVEDTPDPDAIALGVTSVVGSGLLAFAVIPAIVGIFGGGENGLVLNRRPLIGHHLAYLASLLILMYTIADGKLLSKQKKKKSFLELKNKETSPKVLQRTF